MRPLDKVIIKYPDDETIDRGGEAGTIATVIEVDENIILIDIEDYCSYFWVSKSEVELIED